MTLRERAPKNMLHQLVFQSLLGEIDYGAMGDFNPAGCVPPRTPCLAGRAQRASLGWCTAALCGALRWRQATGPGVGGGQRGAGYTSDAVGIVQFQPGQHLGVERPRSRLDLPGKRSLALQYKLRDREGRVVTRSLCGRWLAGWGGTWMAARAAQCSQRNCPGPTGLMRSTLARSAGIAAIAAF